MLLHAKHAACRTIIKTVDSDVVILAVGLVNEIGNKLWIEYGTGRSIRTINIPHLASHFGHSAKGVVFLHAISGCDTVSSLIGIGKKNCCESCKDG